jgi:hypothetical protein
MSNYRITTVYQVYRKGDKHPLLTTKNRDVAERLLASYEQEISLGDTTSFPGTIAPGTIAPGTIAPGKPMPPDIAADTATGWDDWTEPDTSRHVGHVRPTDHEW